MENTTIIVGTGKVKTSGKIIISGEHSVVYHKPALVMAINLYTQVTCKVTQLIMEQGPGLNFSIRSSSTPEPLICNYTYRKEQDDTQKTSNKEIAVINELISKEFFSFIESNQNFYKFQLDVESQIPVGAGLGSSAAYSIALSLYNLGRNERIIIIFK